MNRKKCNTIKMNNIKFNRKGTTTNRKQKNECRTRQSNKIPRSKVCILSAKQGQENKITDNDMRIREELRKRKQQYKTQNKKTRKSNTNNQIKENNTLQTCHLKHKKTSSVESELQSPSFLVNGFNIYVEEIARCMEERTFRQDFQRSGGGGCRIDSCSV